MSIARIIVWSGILVCTMSFWMMVGMMLANYLK